MDAQLCVKKKSISLKEHVVFPREMSADCSRIINNTQQQRILQRFNDFLVCFTCNSISPRQTRPILRLFSNLRALMTPVAIMTSLCVNDTHFDEYDLEGPF